jgi:hypothetical protein
MKSAKSKAAAPIKPTLDPKTAALRTKRLERDAAKATATPSTPPAKPEPKRTTGYWIRRAIIAAYPNDITNEQIDAALVAAGIHNTKKSTISTAKMDCIHTLKVAQELGKLIVNPAPVTATGASAPQSASEHPTEQAAAQ